ncbi:unnamed protein product [Blepharisma stoltei]|uniref:Uncharacterized protein n=1 Tax=Blepharisma stoltei TaxID=1481888 RepID=A0AAU9I6W3_9CILI|nr:unnamed protein product [Blepharisma stoltei]
MARSPPEPVKFSIGEACALENPVNPAFSFTLNRSQRKNTTVVAKPTKQSRQVLFYKKLALGLLIKNSKNWHSILVNNQWKYRLTSHFKLRFIFFCSLTKINHI